MATANESEHATGTGAAATSASQRMQLGIRLQPVNHSDQPVFANFTVVQGAPGTVFIDFGFLEPSVMPALAQLAQSGGKVPETINGRLASRVALGLGAAEQLALQLDQYLRNIRAQMQRAADGKPAQPAT